MEPNVMARMLRPVELPQQQLDQVRNPLLQVLQHWVMLHLHRLPMQQQLAELRMLLGMRQQPLAIKPLLMQRKVLPLVLDLSLLAKSQLLLVIKQWHRQKIVLLSVRTRRRLEKSQQRLAMKQLHRQTIVLLLATRPMQVN